MESIIEKLGLPLQNNILVVDEGETYISKLSKSLAEDSYKDLVSQLEKLDREGKLETEVFGKLSLSCSGTGENVLVDGELYIRPETNYFRNPSVDRILGVLVDESDIEEAIRGEVSLLKQDSQLIEGVFMQRLINLFNFYVTKLSDKNLRPSALASTYYNEVNPITEVVGIKLIEKSKKGVLDDNEKLYLKWTKIIGMLSRTYVHCTNAFPKLGLEESDIILAKLKSMQDDYTNKSGDTVFILSMVLYLDFLLGLLLRYGFYTGR